MKKSGRKCPAFSFLLNELSTEPISSFSWRASHRKVARHFLSLLKFARACARVWLALYLIT